MITEEDIDEWFESQVTKHFFELIQKRLDTVYEMRSSVFCPGEPHKTQEVKAHLLGAEGELGSLLDAFTEKDLSNIEEPEVDQQVRNPSRIRPGAH